MNKTTVLGRLIVRMGIKLLELGMILIEFGGKLDGVTLRSETKITSDLPAK